tara:strand:- start:520 stop:846 length:327 start_codon:yes stop_codon:yes gene_type:complete
MRYGTYCKSINTKYNNIKHFINKIFDAPERININVWLDNFSESQKIYLNNELKLILRNSISDRKIKKIFEKQLPQDEINNIIDFIDLQKISYDLVSNICYNLEKTCQI